MDCSISFQRICAIVRRHYLVTFRTFDKFANVIYWPFISIVVWGLSSVGTKASSLSIIPLAKLLIAISLWQIVIRVTVETAKGVLDELLSRNLVNIFSSPLKISEWILAIMFLGFANVIVIISACSLFTYMLYGLNIFMLGFHMIPCMISLLLTGWCIGFTMAALFIRFGMKVNDFLHVIVWGVAPFSAIYASIDILPAWAQNIAHCLPLMYVFESMRQALTTGTINNHYILISFALNCIYFVAVLCFFNYAFQSSRSMGIARLE